MEMSYFGTLGLKSSPSWCRDIQNHDSSGDDKLSITYPKEPKIGKYSMSKEELDAALTGFCPGLFY